MKIYPAIDLKSGKCVRLFQGDFEQVTAYSSDPIAVAKSFAEQGANFLHVVDLDGAAQGQLQHSHLDLVLKIIAETGLQIQLGGGIRNEEYAKQLIDNGISRIVLGSIAIAEPEKVKEWLHTFGLDQIVLALDIRKNAQNDPMLASHGWKKASELNLWKLLDKYRDTPLQHVLCTDIDRDGTLQGPSIDLYKECIQRYPELHFQASGGISVLTDLRALADIPVSGAVIGKAIYEKKFSLNEAFIEVDKC